MNKFIYKGDECNLGRFGQVRKNDLLILTDQEAEAVVNDRKRFVAVTPADEKDLPKPGTFVPLTNKMTPLQREAAEAVNKVERERLDQLDKANDLENVEVLEIKTKTFDQLIAISERINAHERGAIDIGKKTSKAEIIRQILVHRRNYNKGDAPAAPLEEQAEQD